MGKEISTFGDIEIENSKFYHKINTYKHFIGYLYNDHKVKPLHIVLPKTNAYVKNDDEQTKWMYFLIEDDGLLEKYNIVWDKVTADIKKEFDSEPVYNIKFFENQNKILWQ